MILITQYEKLLISQIIHFSKKIIIFSAICENFGVFACFGTYKHTRDMFLYILTKLRAKRMVKMLFYDDFSFLIFSKVFFVYFHICLKCWCKLVSIDMRSVFFYVIQQSFIEIMGSVDQFYSDFSYQNFENKVGRKHI